jgi:hypothetical protein
MKGLVFTYLLEFLEAEHGLVFVDRLLSETDLPSGGAYTVVGTYDASEMIALIGTLSRLTGQSPREVCILAGSALFPRLMESLVDDPAEYASAVSVIESLESIIHVHVRKLYPDAELPRFDTRRLDDDRLEVIYQSSRPFADLAEGLMRGCCDHFGENVEISRDASENGAFEAKFLLVRRNRNSSDE